MATSQLGWERAEEEALFGFELTWSLGVLEAGILSGRDLAL